MAVAASILDIGAIPSLTMVNGDHGVPWCQSRATSRVSALGRAVFVLAEAAGAGVVRHTENQGVGGAFHTALDSALTLAIAVDALGADKVMAVMMPSRYTADMSQQDAEQQARTMGVEYKVIAIETAFNAFLDLLAPSFAGTEPDTTEENIQARIRGNLVMAMSNKFGWIVLTTGNKSELATGYCTLYGDMAGGFAVIKDVPKTMVFDLCRWRNRQGDGAVIPDTIITRPPSAELRADQKDTDSLPPYEILDPILECYVEKDMGVDAIIARGFEADTVRRIVRLVDLNEYKRRQGPPGVRITPKAFGRDRRMPITNRYRNGCNSR